MIQEFRGDGTTTKQMKEAKLNAIFIWCNRDLKYPKNLALYLNRPDLQIVSPQWLDRLMFRGMNISDVILDHYFIPTYKQYQILKEVKARIR